MALQPDILFQDARFVVLNKPAGLPVHPGPRSAASVEDMFPQLSRRRDGPWLAHRLDADTAGCLVIALRRAALLQAQAEFAAGRAEKIYWAVVQGRPAATCGRIETPLIKRNTAQGWRMEASAQGQKALTDWRVLGAAGEATLLELRPRTGRTHQIRVHCALIGHPLVGDAIYGKANGRLQLLSRSIRLALDPPVEAVAPLPEHMQAVLF